MLSVTINGQERQVPENVTVVEVIQLLNLANRAVAVEINQRLVPRKEHPQTRLRAGDMIEIVTLVGGG